ncbi:MAG: glycosyltransferase family 2 protein [Opitutaceae bacterium]|nr:glycosyltransferase family 2 protein [Opitutaceae bacterium]
MDQTPEVVGIGFRYSVIIPHRDRFELLTKLVASIPERDDIEVLVVDDASDAPTKEKLSALESARRQLRLFHQPAAAPQGAGWARNIGIEHAAGDYLVFADSDDAFTPDAFEAFDDHAAEGHHDLVVFKASAAKVDGSASTRTDFTHFLIETAIRMGEHGPIDRREILARIDPPWAKLVRRELVRQHNLRFDEIHHSNDVLFNLRVLTHARRIEVCAQEVYQVLDHPASLVRVRSAAMLEERFDACLRFNREFAQQGYAGRSFSVTGGYVWQARSYGVAKMWELVRRSLAHDVRLFYPLPRYLGALIMKLRGVHPLQIRFYVVFGRRE